MNRLRTRLRASIADGPLVLLDFLSGGLDPRITFSRGSNATLVDATGKITYAPANLFTYSQEFDNAAWLKQASTATANSAVAPDGTTTADKLIETATTAQHFTYVAIPVTASTRYTMSVYGKAAERRYLSLHLNNFSAGATFDLQTGTVVGTPVSTGGATSSIISVGNGWYRCIVSGTSAGTATYNNQIGIGLTGTLNSNINANESYTGDGTSGVFIWGAQLEPVTYQTTPSTYVATTASAYYGPRFDYDPVTLAPKGLLIEEARTNLLTYSAQFDNAAWSKFNAPTITANDTSAPDGTIAADRVTATSATKSTVFAANSLIGAASTFSIYAKFGTARFLFIEAGGALNSVWYDLQNGVITNNSSGGTASIKPFGNGWYLCTASVAISPINAAFGFTDTSGATSQTIGQFSWVWGAQLEAGSFATSYIPTVASTVTRSADVATMTGTNFSSWYNQSEGTFIAGYDSAASGFGIIGNNTSGYVLASSTRDLKTFNGTTSVTSANTLAVGAIGSGAVSYDSTGRSVVLNGGAAATAAGVLQTITTLFIGHDAAFSGARLNGHIRQIAYYNTRLPNASLQTLTAPSLATTLSLSFTNQAYTVGV